MRLAAPLLAAVAAAGGLFAHSASSRAGFVKNPIEIATSGRLPTITSGSTEAVSTSTMTVRLSGSSSSRLTLQLDAGGSAAARAAFTLTVTRGATTIYCGPLPRLRRIALGLVRMGDSRAYRFRLALSAPASSSTQGLHVAYAAHWHADQA
jgi:hypothetical protein